MEIFVWPQKSPPRQILLDHFGPQTPKSSEESFSGAETVKFGAFVSNVFSPITIPAPGKNGQMCMEEVERSIRCVPIARQWPHEGAPLGGSDAVSAEVGSDARKMVDDGL